MSTTSLVTADNLLAMPTGMGNRYELVAGELRVMSPSGWRHGNVISNFHTRLASFVEKHDFGMMFGAETGFRLARDPDTVRAPDVAFIAKQDLPSEMPAEAFWPGPPDLAVEVLSPSDRTGSVDEKIAAWLAAGCAAVWEIDPEIETVTVYQSRITVQVKSVGEVLEGGPVVPGFSCAIKDLIR
ncbi:MAG TPA: Uma2 family endonuclease [Lacipirellulaceae bacterium]|nr:Uma2 family endonuclease [Lacipirellulaceae bacterium]